MRRVLGDSDGFGSGSDGCIDLDVFGWVGWLGCLCCMRAYFWLGPEVLDCNIVFTRLPVYCLPGR